MVLSGAATVTQLESNLRARDVLPLNVPWQGLAREPEQYWKDRALQWPM